MPIRFMKSTIHSIEIEGVWPRPAYPACNTEHSGVCAKRGDGQLSYAREVNSPSRSRGGRLRPGHISPECYRLRKVHPGDWRYNDWEKTRFLTCIHTRYLRPPLGRAADGPLLAGSRDVRKPPTNVCCPRKSRHQKFRASVSLMTRSGHARSEGPERFLRQRKRAHHLPFYNGVTCRQVKQRTLGAVICAPLTLGVAFFISKWRLQL
jgi:hypothetical protein